MLARAVFRLCRIVVFSDDVIKFRLGIFHHEFAQKGFLAQLCVTFTLLIVERLADSFALLVRRDTCMEVTI